VPSEGTLHIKGQLHAILFDGTYDTYTAKACEIWTAESGSVGENLIELSKDGWAIRTFDRVGILLDADVLVLEVVQLGRSASPLLHSASTTCLPRRKW
jgi:hypothetical protein